RNYRPDSVRSAPSCDREWSIPDRQAPRLLGRNCSLLWHGTRTQLRMGAIAGNPLSAESGRPHLGGGPLSPSESEWLSRVCETYAVSARARHLVTTSSLPLGPLKAHLEYLRTEFNEPSARTLRSQILSQAQHADTMNLRPHQTRQHNRISGSHVSRF